MRELTFAIALLLAVPAASAWVIEAETAALDIQGDTVSSPSLAVARLGTPVALTSFDSWALEAESVRIVTEHVQSNATVLIAVNDPPYETSSQHRDLTARPAEVRGGAQLLVVPTGAASITHEGGDVEVGPSAIATYFEAGILGRPSPHRTDVDVADTARFTAPSDFGRITITGDFKLALWETDWIVFDEAGATEYKSGHEREGFVPGQPQPPNGHVGRSHQRDVFMYVTNGTLHLETASAGNLEYFVHDFTGNWPILRLDQATGIAKAPGIERTFQNGSLRVDGPVDVGVRVESETFVIAATTDASSIEIAGETILIPLPEGSPEPDTAGAAPAIPSEASRNAVLWAAVLAGAVMLFGVVWIIVRRPYWTLAVANDLRRDDYVVRHAPDYFGQARRRAAAARLYSVALVATGQYEVALEFLEALTPEDRPDAGSFGLLMAASAVGAGQLDVANSYMPQARAARRPLMRRLRRAPGWSSIHESLRRQARNPLRDEGYA